MHVEFRQADREVFNEMNEHSARRTRIEVGGGRRGAPRAVGSGGRTDARPSGTTPLLHVFSVNEINVWRLLGRALTGRETYIYHSDPLFPFLRRPLGAVVSQLQRFDCVKSVRALAPDSIWYNESAGLGMFADYYPKIEPVADRWFDDMGIGSLEPDDLYPARKVAHEYLERLLGYVYLAEWIGQIVPDTAWRLHGARRDFSAVYAMCKNTDPDSVKMNARQNFRFANTSILIAAIVKIAVMTVARTRWRVEKESHVFAADAWPKGQEWMVRRLTDTPDETLIYQRNREHVRRGVGKYGANRTCFKEDGRLAPGELLSYVRLGFRHALRTYRVCGNIDPALFFLLQSLAVKRLMFRALFNRYPVKFFWGRDDYSVDHVIRNQELRRIGGTSLGISHGLPMKVINQAWRHIDFDIYYTYGIHLYRNYYLDSWAPHMRIEPIGTIHMLRRHLERLNEPRPNAIIYFVNPRPENPFFMKEIFKVARHFPDRTVYVKVKPSRRLDGQAEADLKMLSAPAVPANVVETQESTYDLMFRASYAVSTGSTVGAEAIQYGLKSFWFDFPSIGEYYYFRDFPEACIKTGDDLIRHIEAIESGEETYRFERFADLIDLSGRYAIDVIRKDMGLGPLPREIDA